CEEEVAEAIGEPTMEEYMTKTRKEPTMMKRLDLTYSLSHLMELQIEANRANTKDEWDPANIEFEKWLASKFRNHKTMDRYTKNALWDYWRIGDDKEVITDSELSNFGDDNLIEENEIA
ncbi:hypothetical protein Tco_1205810, partial [Tanacetum coccineum]